MTTYLAIITTVLVITQVIRVTQNAISLYRNTRDMKKSIGWINEKYPNEKDFENQRIVYELLRQRLENEECEKEN